MSPKIYPELYRLFGDLLDYPGPATANVAHRCAALAADRDPEAGMHLVTFALTVSGLEAGRIEEIYTGAFEINPASFIYAGYVLFGESFKRGAFMVKLQDEYRRYDFCYDGELADHLALIFRFLSLLPADDPLLRDLTGECIAPALHQMLDAIDADNPYASLLRGILRVIDPDNTATLAAVLQVYGGGFLPQRISSEVP
ncbi:MAG: hypothetical protein MI924_04530 [Chloroflexales bacterium]|nr:hypothetical protein [Chloroflexales bacterium]